MIHDKWCKDNVKTNMLKAHSICPSNSLWLQQRFCCKGQERKGKESVRPGHDFSWMEGCKAFGYPCGTLLSSRRWVMSAESSKQKSGIKMNQTCLEEREEWSHSSRSVPGSGTGTGFTTGSRRTEEQTIKYALIIQFFKRVYITVIIHQWFLTVLIHFTGRNFSKEQKTTDL